MTLDLLQGQIKKIDEYEYFGKAIKHVHSLQPENTKALVSSLNEQQQTYLKNLMQSKRIPIQRKGVRTTVARRILKPKKHTQPPSTEMH